MTTCPLPPPSPPLEALETLYLQHHGWLQAWLRRKLASAADAADIAHDTFLRVLVSRPRMAEPRAFLTTIARGLVVDQWRRQELERAYLEALALQPEPLAHSPETQLLVVEALVRLDRLLDGLKPRVRQAFVWAQLDELPHAQIAERLGVTVRSVERYVAEALYHCHLLLDD